MWRRPSALRYMLLSPSSHTPMTSVATLLGIAVPSSFDPLPSWPLWFKPNDHRVLPAMRSVWFAPAAARGGRTLITREMPSSDLNGSSHDTDERKAINTIGATAVRVARTVRVFFSEVVRLLPLYSTAKLFADS